MMNNKLSCPLFLAALIVGTLTWDFPLREGSGEPNNGNDINGEHNCTSAVDTVDGEKCIPSKVCYNDNECKGGSCLGIAVGKCNCGACISLLSCEDDSACGGLIGACNNETSLCDCELGFKTHSIGSIFDALVNVCNVRECVPNTDSCFGLPCNSGVCVCP